ncbi:hypothetical protein CPB86DRAFT_864103 [Serendipita vermifera]|nr:hypothetical protein CPB86DRAFT_864103 [Serendipita vermifera]
MTVHARDVRNGGGNALTGGKFDTRWTSGNMPHISIHPWLFIQRISPVQKKGSSHPIFVILLDIFDTLVPLFRFSDIDGATPPNLLLSKSPTVELEYALLLLSRSLGSEPNATEARVDVGGVFVVPPYEEDLPSASSKVGKIRQTSLNQYFLTVKIAKKDDKLAF